ncbi:MAG: glycosyltransferase [Bacteroides sp.]|jgi:rhamnosyl/mannosyltransferase|nr:glycosyltransferase [Bacteroides sp.]MCI1684042.1 glycosyltransferase [Bacteroides sp.]
MKILQIGKFYPIRGGIEKVMYNIMLGLSRKGICCDMLCAAEDQHPGIIRINDNARILCVPTWKKVSGTMIAPCMISELYRIKSQYDVVHIHHPDPMAALSLFLSGYRGKVVLHWHSDIFKQRLLLKFYRPLQNWLIKRADIIVGTTPVYVQQSPFLQRVKTKLTCIPIGIDQPVFNPQKVAQIKACYPERKIIFSLGRLVGYKGYRYMIESARYLNNDCVILIGGAGPLKEDLEKIIRLYGLEDRVKLLGYISDDDLPGYYGACDIFCLSSIQKNEAFGIVQIEAMSYGKPVVATRIKESGVSWVNAHGKSGFNVAPGEGRPLADAISTILFTPKLYAILSEGAYQRFQTMFSIEIMTEHCLELYNKVLSQ